MVKRLLIIVAGGLMLSNITVAQPRQHQQDRRIKAVVVNDLGGDPDG